MNESYSKGIYEEAYGVPISDYLELKIVQEWDKLQTIKEIARNCNISAQTVKRLINKMGLSISRRDEIYNNAIRDLMNNGYTGDMIAEELGISRARVYYRINKMKKREKKIPKRKKKQENDKIDNAIIQGLREGKTQRQIASEMKIDPAVVSRRIKEMKERGEEIPKRKKKQENDEIDDAIIQGLREGKPKSQIARELKIAVTTVYKRINKMTKRGGEIPTISKKQSDDETIQRPEEKKSSQDQKNINEKIIRKYEEAMLYIIQLKKPTQDQIKKLAEYYGIDADAFFEKYRNKINFFLDRGGYR